MPNRMTFMERMSGRLAAIESVLKKLEPVEKTGFIFAANAESLPRPLNVLFRNAEHVRWIQ